MIVHRFDPAQAYMDAAHPTKRHHGRRGPPYREAAVFGPGVPGGSRQMTEEELAPLRSRADERQTARHDSIARVQERFSDVLLVKAAELASNGVVTIATTVGSVDARIVRFWRGNAVLEIEVLVPSSCQRQAAKILLIGDHVSDACVLGRYLTRFVARLGPDVEVLGTPPM